MNERNCSILKKIDQNLKKLTDFLQKIMDILKFDQY